MRPASRLILALDVPDANRAVALAEKCKPHVDAFKVGLPLALSAGLESLRRISRIGPVLADFKIADIPTVSADIARTAFAYGARGVICHGFVGEDTVRAVVAVGEGEVFVLAEMSHPGGREFSAPAAEDIARMAVRAGAQGIVAPATRPERIRRLRVLIGALQILAPGAGAQGGQPSDAIRAGADFVIVGRAIVDAPDPAASAKAMVEEIATARGKP